MTQKKVTIPFLNLRSGEYSDLSDADMATIRYNLALGRLEASIDGGPYQALGGSGDGNLYNEIIGAISVTPYLDGYLPYVDGYSTELGKITVQDLVALVGAGGGVSSVGLDGGTTGLTFSGTNPITTSGTLTLTGTLGSANGGTGLASPGALNNVLTSDGAGGWTSSTPSSTAPGGAVNNVQLNDGAGDFAGYAALTFDNATTEMLVGSGTAHNIKIAPVGSGGSPLIESDDSMKINVDNLTGSLGLQVGGIDIALVGGDDGYGMSYLQTQAGVRLETQGELWIKESAAPALAVTYGKLWANSAADARPYWIDETGEAYNLTLDRFNTLTPAASVTINASPSLPVFNSLALNQDTTFTTAGLGNGRSASVRVICDASTRTLTFPVGWTWLGSSAPASLAAGDVGYLSITAYGTNDADVIAAWSYENAPAAVAGSGTTTQIAYFSNASSISSEVAVGSNAFTWDAANNRLGVGTSTPNEAATINGSVSFAEGTAPSATAGYGKLYALSADSRPYFMDDGGQAYNLTLDRFNTLTPAASVTIDASPSLPVFNSLALNQDTTFTTFGLGDGRSASVRVVCDGTTRTLTFPIEWTWLGSIPASLAAGDTGYLSLTAYGTADTDVIAAWSYENAPAVIAGSGVDNQISIWSGTNSQDGSANLTFNGTTLGVTGGITQTGGAVSLTGNGSSSLTTSSGALTLTSAAAATWSATAGDLSLTATANSVVVTGAEAAADAITLTASNAAGGIDVNAGTGGVTIDTTAAFSIDGATASNVTVTGSAQSLTLSAAGGGAQKVLVQSAGTGVDAVDLVATAGGFSIDGAAASNVTATGADLTVSTATSGSLNLTSAAAVNVTSASNLQISANGNATTWPTAAGTSGQALANNGAGALSWTAMPANGGLTPKLGNVLVVDAVNGNDGTGTVNGPPFATVEAAIAYINTNSLTGVTVWIMPGTYTLASLTTGLTIPATCALRGMNAQTTKIVMTANNPGGTVTLLTMGENTRVEDISLTLNSSNATTNLVGIALPGTTSSTSKLRTAVLTIDNSGLAVGTTTNVYGILDNGTGSVGPPTFSFNFTRGVTVNVFSNGGGNKRGVLVSTANDVTFRDTNFYVRAPTDSASTGSYVGVETTDPDCSAQFRTSSISGPTTAGSYTGSDIYQASPAAGYTYKGVVLGPGCDLINKTAGGKSFTTYTTPITLLYCANASLLNGTHYLWPGTLPSGGDNTEVFYRFQQKAIIQGLAINCRTAPGTGHGVTVTIRRSTTGASGSGVATSMTVSITNSTNAGTHFTSSEDFAQGEFMSVQITTPGGPGAAADLVVEIDLF